MDEDDLFGAFEDSRDDDVRTKTAKKPTEASESAATATNE